MKSKNLKSKLMISLFGIFTLGANAQVKIGVNPTTIDASAMLQIDVSQTSGSSKGFLLPRVPLTSLTDATTIASPATGLVVYATGGALAAGLYTWNGTAWVTYDATNDAWVNNPTNTRVELGTTSTGSTRTTGTEFVARDNGNVGIGTATPGARLEVYRRGSSEAGNWIAHFGNSSPRVSLYEENMTFTRNGAATPNSGGGIYFSAANNAIIETSQGGIVLASRQANKNIGLHTYNPLQPLHVDGAQDNPGSGNPNATQEENDMVLTNIGRLGIGSVSPSEKLDVRGNVRFSGALMPNNTAGTAGQVLTSTGANSAPTWQNLNTISGTIASTSTILGTSSLTINASTESDVPGLTYSITVPTGKTQTVLFTILGYAVNNTSSSGAATQGVFSLYQGTTKISSAYTSTGDGGSLVNLPAPTTFIKAVTLTAGTYNFTVKYASWSGDQVVNLVPSSYVGYNGDTEAMLSRMQVLVYNN